MLGWDFSYLSRTERMTSEPLPWSYGSLVIAAMAGAGSMLDMGTGGGEFLSALRPFPPGHPCHRGMGAEHPGGARAPGTARHHRSWVSIRG